MDSMEEYGQKTPFQALKWDFSGKMSKDV